MNNYPPGFDPRDLDDDEAVEEEEQEEEEIDEMEYGSPMLSSENASDEAKILLGNYASL